MLRDYQKKAIADLKDWFSKNKTGNPCLSMPTGSGKSHVIAEISYQARKKNPTSRMLILAHRKELIQQNYDKLIQLMPTDQVGIYSAGLNKKELNRPIICAGIQSIYRVKPEETGHIDLTLIDESHLVDTKDEGRYRSYVGQLNEINPKMRVIGFTATPYRLRGGPIAQTGSLFKSCIEPVKIDWLVEQGYLAPLIVPKIRNKYDISLLKEKSVEYEMTLEERKLDYYNNNPEAVKEILELSSSGFTSMIVFTINVDHAWRVEKIFSFYGKKAKVLHGKQSTKERNEIINAFKSKEIEVITNCDMLTTGFDFPDIDVIALLAPTNSTSRYVQMCGRGMRLKSHTDHCKLLDFVGNVERHGPLTGLKDCRIQKLESEGEALKKPCPNCSHLILLSSMFCNICGYEFPRKPKNYVYSEAEVLPLKYDISRVEKWKWEVYIDNRGWMRRQFLKCTITYPLDSRKSFRFHLEEKGKSAFFALLKNYDLVCRSELFSRIERIFKEEKKELILYKTAIALNEFTAPPRIDIIDTYKEPPQVRCYRDDRNGA